MALTFDHKEYSPSELAKVLSEEYGHKVTPSVVRKWDNEIFAHVVDKKRSEKEARTYNSDDLAVFNAIAALRELDYSLKDVKSILRGTKGSENAGFKPDIVLEAGSKRIVIEIKHQLDKRKKGFEMLEKYLD